MPIYEYECEACNARFEVIQKFSDKPLKKCAKCGGGPIAKLLSPPALHFKGTGWYVTDYARAGQNGGNGGNGKSNGSSKPSEASATTTASSTSTSTSTATTTATKSGD